MSVVNWQRVRLAGAVEGWGSEKEDFSVVFG
jgi:hypothetical protein